jgi:predicted RNase H-like nuclease (RuvC/YqgF family)
MMARVPANESKREQRSHSKRVIQSLECSLTADDVESLGKQVADLTSNVDEKECEIDALKKEVKSLTKTRSEKARIRRAGVEVRDVECDWRIDGSTVTITRLDTGEIVEQRPARPDERQGGFDL